MSFEDNQYQISNGEPAGIQKRIWNGDLCKYQRELLKKLYNIKDPKKIQQTISELVKTTYHVEDEFRKANFYYNEFEATCAFLENLEILHSSNDTQRVTDEFGKEHDHVINHKRSIVKSIPLIRAAVQGT